MDFKRFFSKTFLVPLILVVFVIGMVLWKLGAASEPGPMEEMPQEPAVQNQPLEIPSQTSNPDMSQAEDTAIQEQLDRDRQEQKQTKYLKTKLEQTNLELDQEKALAEINKLRMANMGAFPGPLEGQNDFPEVKVQYIGGDSVKKEAILSIAGVSFQVKEKSTPTDNVQILSISDTGVTLHFTAPHEMTKTIEYKPE